MQENNTKISFKDQHIHTGIDVGKKALSVDILTEHFEHKTFNQPPVPQKHVGTGHDPSLHILYISELLSSAQNFSLYGNSLVVLLCQF